MTTKQHTPTPWKYEVSEFDRNHSSDITIFAETAIHKNRKSIARVYGEGNLSSHTAERDANAAFIVRSRNAHEELVGVIRATLADMEDGTLMEDSDTWQYTLDAIRAALRKAEGI